MLGGERFFGTSWEALLRSKGRVLEAEVGYEETPTTQAQRVAMRDVQAPDPALPIEPVSPEAALFGRTTSEVYLLKRAHASLTAVGRLTRVGLDATAEKREYVPARQHRGRVPRRPRVRQPALRARTFAEVSARPGRCRLCATAARIATQLYDLSVSRELGSRTTVSLTGHHLSRSGDLEEYDANWVSLGLQMTF